MSGQRSVADTRVLLEERARVLARPVTEQKSARTAFTLFRIGGERHAIESRYVHAVIRPKNFASLPGAPPHLRGVTNVRGEIVLAVDLRPLLGLEQTTLTENARLLVCGTAAPELAIIAEEADEMVEIDQATIDSPEWLRGDRSGTWVQGVTADALILLDATKLLGDERFYIRRDSGGGRRKE